MSRFYSFYFSEYRCQLDDSSYREISTFLLIAILAPFTILAPVGFVVAGFDPFRYLLDYFCPHPMHRSVVTIVIVAILRSVGFTFACLELFRSCAWGLFIALVVFNRILSIRKRLIRCLRHGNTHCLVATMRMISIGWNNVNVYLTNIMNIGFTVTFLEIVMITWLCIKGSPESVGGLLYWWFAVLLLVIICIVIGYVRTGCWIFDQAQKMSFAVKLQTKFIHARRAKKETKLCMLTAKALVPIQVKYVLIGPIGGGFLVTYIQALLLRVIDAILIVDFETT